jgi:hypothetical protein
MPNLLAQYADMSGNPVFPAPELTLIITPYLFFIIKGRTALENRKAPVRLMLIVLHHSSSEVSINFLT